MNILFLAPYFPSINAFHAGGVLMGREIEELSKQHNVYVLCFSSEGQNDDMLYYGLFAKDVKCIKLKPIDKLKNVITHPLMACMFATRCSRKFENYIKEFIVKYRIDAVHIEYAAMGQYIDLIHEISQKIKCTLVLQDVTYQSFVRQRDVEQNLLKKLFFALQVPLTYKNEKNFVQKSDYVLTLCDKDTELVEKLYKKEAITINTYFDVKEALKIGKAKKYEETKNKKICFYGQMGRTENHIAAMKLVDIVQGMNDVKTYIIGNEPKDTLKRRATDNIIVTGFVDKPYDILETCDIAVFPLTVGAGIKTKVLHCLALGIPVITTAIGAEGIDDGRVIDIVETDDEFKSHIVERLNDCEWLKNTSKKGIELIERNFLWERTTRVFSRIYRS